MIRSDRCKITVYGSETVCHTPGCGNAWDTGYECDVSCPFAPRGTAFVSPNPGPGAWLFGAFCLGVLGAVVMLFYLFG